MKPSGHNIYPNPTQIFKRLLTDHIYHYRRKIFTAVFFMIIAALCSALIVRLTKPVVDKILIQHDSSTLLLITGLIIIIYTIKGIAEYFQNYLIKFVGQQILTDLQIKMYRHLLNTDYSVLQKFPSGKLISRFTNDIILLRGAVANTLVGCAKHLLSVVFLIGIMFSLDLYLSLLVFLAFPLTIYPIQKLSRTMRGVVHNSQEELSNFTVQLDESFNAIKVIKSYCMEEYEFQQARRITDKMLGYYKRAAKLDSMASPLMEVLSGLTIVGLIWYGDYAISNNYMTTGTLFTFIMAFVSAYRPYKSLVALNVNIQEGLAAATRIFNILDITPSIIDKPGAREDIIFTTPNIKYENIGLTFPKNRVALSQYNLEVMAGKTYAIVGSSGSGKTSVANLTMRLFDPTEGSIYIDGVNVKDIALQTLRCQIAFVTQDTLLFDASVADNISYVNEIDETAKDKERIIKAAKAADAHNFIMALPHQYDSLVGANGQSLSGGQRQRLSIARAFYKDAPILVLDEATSALDPVSERCIIGSLKKLRKNKTTLIITHRLNSITDVDQIIVMSNGTITEQGTHQELLNQRGEYYQLYNKELNEIDKYV
ncbi:MAG: ABC transporter ATP-binding protein [Rickettsiaceae bacterium]|nr:ABC transporter ATP-binding protein [Rickettsiaceae bacterium]